MKVKAVKVNRAHYFLTDPRTCEDRPCGNNSHCTGPNQCTCNDGYHRVNDACASNRYDIECCYWSI